MTKTTVVSFWTLSSCCPSVEFLLVFLEHRCCPCDYSPLLLSRPISVLKVTWLELDLEFCSPSKPSDESPFRTTPTQFELTRSVCVRCTSFPWHHLWEFCSLIKEFRSNSYRVPEHHRCEEKECTDRREDVRSATALTISTSLIHNIAAESDPEQTQISVLNLTFQKRDYGKRRELVEVQLWDLGSLVVNHTILKIDSFCIEWRIPS